MKNALQLTSIFKTIGTTDIGPIDLTIDQGSFLCLLGPSGAGKTTLLMMIAGLISPDKGTIHLNDTALTTQKIAQRGVAMMFQDGALFPYMSAYDNIAFGLKMRGTVDREDITAIAKLLRIEDLLNRYPNELSGGQKQRVALARSLVLRPKLMLLDEPLSALDYELREELGSLIRQIHDEFNLTTIMVTHNPREALRLSTHIAAMQNGNIIQIGTSSDIYENPANETVARMLGPVVKWAGKIARPEAIRFGSGTKMNITKREFLGASICLYMHNHDEEIKIELPANEAHQIPDETEIHFDKFILKEM